MKRLNTVKSNSRNSSLYKANTIDNNPYEDDEPDVYGRVKMKKLPTITMR